MDVIPVSPSSHVRLKASELAMSSDVPMIPSSQYLKYSGRNLGTDKTSSEIIRLLSTLFDFMARLARVVALDTPHHVTQRGNGRRAIFESDADRIVYLDLLRQHCAVHRLS